LIFTLLFLVYTASFNFVKAKDYNELPLKRGVNIDKEWTIKFNKTIDLKTVNTRNIRVLDENNEKIQVKLRLGRDKKSINVEPIQEYEYGKTYYLFIEEGLKSIDGKKLTEETRMEFIAKRPLPSNVDKAKDTDNRFTICIDAGQVWADYVVGNAGTRAKDINIAVALKLGKILEDKGAKVVYTRKSNRVQWSLDSDIQNRIRINEEAEADLFLSINTNAYDKENVNGIETYYLQGNTQGEEIAEKIQKQLIRYTGRSDRGVKYKQQSKLLEGTSSPSLLVELGFITNIEEEKLLKSKEYQQKCAEAIAEAVVNYAGTADINDTDDTEHKDDTDNSNDTEDTDSIVIDKVENINRSIIQGDKFNFPKKITAIMSDGSRQEVEVSWSTLSVNTDKAGTYTYSGTVKDYNDTVKLTLKIEKKQQKKYKVTLNPARGGFDSGAVGTTGLKEKDVNLDVVLRAGKLLEKEGIEVVYTRKSDNVNWNKDNEIQERVKISNNAGSDLMVTVGCNSYDLADTNGIETYYMDGDKNGKSLAQYIQNELVKKTGGKYRGVKGVDYLNTIKLSKAPSVWTAIGFITNDVEQERLANDEYKDRCAQAVSEGIKKYLDEIEKNGNVVDDEDDSQKVYFNDIVEYIKKGDKYSLPAKVKVTLDDGVTKEVFVEWNKKSVDTNKIGVYRYEGTIKESSKKVSLVLIITHTGKAKFKVAVDPGHGGHDPGAIGITGVKEKNVALAVGLKVGNYLVKNDVEVIYTRTSDNITFPKGERENLQARCDIANNANVDLFVSVHANSYYAETAHGIETYYFRGSTSGNKVASIVQSELIKETGAVNRGAKGKGYYVLDKVDTTSILVELGFLSNLEEEIMLVNQEYQDKCAKAIARGILKSLGVNNIVLD
jgi:N-acetylmuramoyl-L-alanine amidase